MNSSKDIAVKRRSPFEIAGVRVSLGKSRTIYLSFSESYLGEPVRIPIRVIRARQKGPVLGLMGAIHGDELSGVGIIRNLLFDTPPRLNTGALICVPVVNVFGFENHERYLPDRRDLNRSFPGFENGSLAARLAHALFNQVVLKCDYLIDFHSAAVRRTNYPNIRADMRNPAVKNLARAFGSELIVNGKGPEGSLRRAACKAGVPCVILEAGEVFKNEPGVVEIGARGVLNVMRTLGMIKGLPEEPLFQVAVQSTVWVRAQRGGFLGFHVKPGDLVRRGQPLATNFNVFGRERTSIISPDFGIVLGMTTMPAVKPGEPVFHIATLTQTSYSRIRKKILLSQDEDLFNRLQEDLSTNIFLQEFDPR